MTVHHPNLNRHKVRVTWATALLLLLGQLASAHPVTYEGGTSLMGEQMGASQTYTVTHSLRSWFSAGIEWRPLLSPSARLSLLVKRWNNPGSQANLLLSGTARADGEAGAMIAQADWESRRLYTMLESRTEFETQRLPLHNTKLRLGFAPYLAEFDELSFWLILEDRKSTEQSSVFPILRFYYRNALWEVGGTQ